MNFKEIQNNHRKTTRFIKGATFWASHSHVGEVWCVVCALSHNESIHTVDTLKFQQLSPKCPVNSTKNVQNTKNNIGAV